MVRGGLRVHAHLLAVVATLGLSVQASAQSVNVNPGERSPQAAASVPASSVDLTPFVPGGTTDRFKRAQASPSGFAADLFAPLPGEFKRLGAQENWLVAGLGGLGTAAAHSLDSTVASANWTPSASTVMHPGQIVGSFAAQTAAALTAYTAGRISGSPRVARVGAELFRAQMVSQLTAQALKYTVDRTRPDGTSLSFPSGHSASMFATATVLQSEFGWKVGMPAYAAASWVAASRVEANRHFLSDVVAGATIGILAGRAVTFGSGHTRFAMSPMAVAGGGVGVSFTKVVKP